MAKTTPAPSAAPASKSSGGTPRLSQGSNAERLINNFQGEMDRRTLAPDEVSFRQSLDQTSRALDLQRAQANRFAEEQNEQSFWAAKSASNLAAQNYKDKLNLDAVYGGGSRAANPPVSFSAEGDPGFGRRDLNPGTNRVFTVGGGGSPTEQSLSLLREQSRLAEQEKASQSSRDAAAMGRQAFYESQARAQENVARSASSEKDRASAERIAQMQASSNLFGGLFSSIGQRRQSNFWN